MTTTPTEPKVYTFRYLSIAERDGFVADSLLADALAPDRSLNLKWRSILKLGIKVLPGDTPDDAWLRAMCEENGEPFTTPVPYPIADALVNCRAAYAFYFWLT